MLPEGSRLAGWVGAQVPRVSLLSETLTLVRVILPVLVTKMLKLIGSPRA